ncbi:hypothetical protein [Marivirga sp.]|uniref:hypothetical protein n=1 Tax=Marivirga sp. TaxID=2018662 RepID=UPI003DA7316E
MDIENFTEDKEEIPEIILNRIKSTNLLQDDDSIIMINYRYKQLFPTFETFDDRFVLLSKKQLTRFYTTNDDSVRIQKIDLDSCLNLTITKNTDVPNEVHYSIRGDKIGAHFYSEKTKRYELIPHSDYVYCLATSDYIDEYETMMNLMLSNWKKQKNYDSLRQIYLTHYKVNGERIITKDIRISRQKLNKLKDEVEKISNKVIDETDWLIIVNDGKILHIDYDFFEKNFHVIEIEVENIPTDESDISFVASYYFGETMGGRDTLSLPHEYKTDFSKTTYIGVKQSYENSINDVLELYFQN